MLPYNQQSVADANFGTLNQTALTQQWATAYSAQPNYGNYSSEKSQLNLQDYWTEPDFQQPISSHHQYHQFQYQQSQYLQSSQFNENYLCPVEIPGQLQVTQIPVRPLQTFCPAPSQQQTQQECPSERAHQARINIVQNSSGGFRAIIKRKRKRTMFTTEQVQALESVFQMKPYVTRNERQVLVTQLKLSDTCVKIWFQNRRMRGKRAVEEAAAEAAEIAIEEAIQEEQKKREQIVCDSTDSSVESTDTESSCSPDKVSHLDCLESKLLNKTDESGYVTLDETYVGQIINVIDSVMSSNVDVDFDIPSSTSSELSC